LQFVRIALEKSLGDAKRYNNRSKGDGMKIGDKGTCEMEFLPGECILDCDNCNNYSPILELIN